MSSNEPHILIADDHSMIRKGLKMYLQINLGIGKVSEVESTASLMKELMKRTHTHLILDIVFGDGSSLEVVPNIVKVYPDIKILVFSMQPQNVYGEVLKQYGIKHYLSKTENEENILNALKKFVNNELNDSEEETNTETPCNPFVSLASRELEILHYLLKGYGTKQIGETLNLKMNTISTLKSRVFEKTKTSNIKELMELASVFNINF